ncbi:MAG: GNAT family N-acetyltransferase [Candidatus Thorarchaeota archaeon]
MEIDVRLATAQDRASLEEFYKREGLDFHGLSSRQPLSSIGTVRETMYIVAATNDIVVAALKLDVVRDPGLGDIGHILHFEIEDSLESTNLGNRMLGKTIELAQEKGLRALDAVVREERQDVIALYLDSEFNEMRKDVHLRRYFRERIF